MEPAAYARIVRALQTESGVSVGAGKGFGAGALRRGGKIFAMLSSRGEFVVKLPKARVDELVAAAVGRRFTAGKGRQMREWLVVELPARALILAREACRR